MKSNILLRVVVMGLAAGLAGCSASKAGPFADVTARDQSRPSDAAPATRPAAEQAQLAPTITVTGSDAASPAAELARNPADSTPAAVVVTDAGNAPTNPVSPAPAPMGHLVVRVDEHGRLSRGFSPSTFERPSGDVKAGPMYWPNRNLTVKRGDIENVAFEPMEFLVDSLLMPIRACITPPWTDVVYDPVPQDNTIPATVHERQAITQERSLKK